MRPGRTQVRRRTARRDDFGFLSFRHR
jgi:hypothetical protein